MPELCEVALTAQYLLTKLKNKYITNAEIVAGKYKKHELKGINYLINKKNKIINIDTKGKFMWFELKDENDRNLYILNWFGLTGDWTFENSSMSRVIFTINNDNNKTKLYFNDQRNFGILQITHDKKILDDKLNSLAPDLLKTNFSVQQFHKWFTDYLEKFPKRKHIKIVALLMKQDIDDGIVSGIGNYMSSEILYRAKILPNREIGKLTDADIDRLAKTIKMVVKMCYLTNKTGYMQDFEDFVDEHLEGVKKGIYPNYHPDIPLKSVPEFEFLVYKLKKDKYGNPVSTENIIPMRTTYFVKNVQN